MTNYEKYQKQIDEIWELGYDIALVNGKILSCDITACKNCGFYSGACKVNIGHWLAAEYKQPEVDWESVAVDTPILVRNNKYDEWQKRHFVKYENSYVYAWNSGHTSWSTKSEFDICGWRYAELAESEEK